MNQNVKSFICTIENGHDIRYGNTIFVSIEDVNREAKNMSNGKLADATLMTSELKMD